MTLKPITGYGSKQVVKGALQRTFFLFQLTSNELLMYKFYKTYNYFIFK